MTRVITGFSMQVRTTVLILGIALGMAASPWPASAQKQVPTSRAEVRLSFAPLVKRAAPAVVNIFTRTTVTTRRVSPLFDDPFFRRFFGEGFGGVPRQKQENALGSGVIVDAGGVIVTNHHVIKGADEIKVILADRREFSARIVGSDERTDLAVLRIDAGRDRLPFLRLRDSDDLEVGDLVLAIGNPFGVGQTVTSGIVSAVARTQSGLSDLNSFIQTDAAINPGNSGGALVTLDGKLAGINTAIFTRTGTSVGIGFAIPANMVRAVVDGITSSGRLVRPWLGGAGQSVTADISNSLGLPRPAGVLINDIHPKGPAARAGVRVGDVVLKVNGREVNDTDGLRFRIATARIGETVNLGIWRRGRAQRVRLPVEAPPEIPRKEKTELSGAHPFQGATIANMSPALADELGLNLMQNGVVVMEIRRGSTAHRLDFKPGDLIRDINGNAASSVDRLKSILSRQVTRWRVAIQRGEKTFSVVINR